MRLIDTSTYELHEFFDGAIPEYTILSHRWINREMTFQDYRKKRNCEGPKYWKIVDACDFVRRRGSAYIWIDTVCIDKKSSAELSEAINSMFHYYESAQACIAFLSDVRPRKDNSLEAVLDDLDASEWFERGWTLQELIAPELVIFCSQDWEEIGYVSKEDRGLQRGLDLSTNVARASGVPVDVLTKRKYFEFSTVAQRMSWAAKRKTTRIEDRAYSLMGLFHVNMPLLYGERDKAFIRLQQEIAKTLLDETLWAWTAGSAFKILQDELPLYRHPRADRAYLPLAAPSPDYFAGSSKFYSWTKQLEGPRFTNIEGGLVVFRPGDKCEVNEVGHETYATRLACLEHLTLVLCRQQCGHYKRLILRDTDQGRRFVHKKAVDWGHKAFYIHASVHSGCGGST